MKTTLVWPEDLFDSASKEAAARGSRLPDFVLDAVRDKLRSSGGFSGANQTDWREFAGAWGRTETMRDELRNVQQRIDEEFGNPDDLE